jgi:hypothetical protein
MVNGVDSVSTNFKTSYGAVTSKWKKTTDETIVEVDIPVNTSAILEIPTEEGSEILEDGVSVSNSPEVKIISQVAGKTSIKLGSGYYKFSFQ